MRIQSEQKQPTNPGQKSTQTRSNIADKSSDSTNMKLRGRALAKGKDGVAIPNDRHDGELLLPLVSEQGAVNGEERRHSTRSAIQRTLRNIRHQWSLVDFPSKVAILFFASLLSLHLMLGTIDLFFHSFGIGSAGSPPHGANTDTYAVVINTYKRPQMLREAVLHYVDRCGKQYGIGQVFVLWAEQGTEPPDLGFFFGDSVPSETLLRNRPSLQFLKSPKDSLNSRFLPIPDLVSDALFMVDDDLKVSCTSLHQGYLAWRSFPDSLVGYYPRLGRPASSMAAHDIDTMTYHNWPEVFFHQRFNLILTKASFLNRKYLDLYSSSSHPSEIKEYIDARMNCEDIAMGMLVANHTRSRVGNPSPPIYVEGMIVDAGLFGGISTGGGHMGKRSECLTDLTRIYTRLDWGVPLAEEVPLKKYAWLHHSPGFWWQYRPSNFCEWFALLHFFL